MEKKRENWIDAVKTIAIFVVLANHAGFTLPGVNFWGGMFYVPVFFVLAGYTYRLKAGSFAGFVRSKGKRLLVPYFVANLVFLLFFTAKELFVDGGLHTVNRNSVLGIFYARNQLFCMADGLQNMMPAVGGTGKNIYFMNLQNAPTWFLPALFLSIVIFDGLMRLFRGNGKKVGLTVAFLFAAALVYHYMSPYLLPWSMDAVPFFLVLIQTGYTVKETKLLERVEQGRREVFAVAALELIFIGTALFNGSANLSIGEYGRFFTVALYNSAMSSLFIMQLCHGLEHCFSKSYLPGWLVKPGKATLTILCYHLFLFLFLGAAITVACSIMRFGSNGYVTGFLKLLMIVAVIWFFTWFEKRKGRVPA